MEKYNPDAVCDKCGGKGIRADFHRGEGLDCGYGSKSICCEIRWSRTEHMVRCCTNCYCRWLEEPLGGKEEK